MKVRDIYKKAASLIGDKDDISNSTSSLTARNIYTIAAALIGDKNDISNSTSSLTARNIYTIAASLIGDKNDISNSTSGLTARNIYTIAAALIGEKDDNTNGRSNMTVRDVYVIAAAFIGDRENDDQDEIDLAPIYFRTLLQEALPAENRIRVAEGMAELTEAPDLGIDDTIPYSDKLVRAAFPYGLAWQYHQDAGNLSLSSQYRNMFIEAVENVKKSKINLTTAYLNILMQEALDCENSIREYFGETTLTSAPFISSLDSAIPYHDSLVRAAFPFGLAWQYHQDAGNFQAATQYRDMFTDAVEKAKKTKIKFAVQYLNILMQESFNCENSIREYSGETTLTSAPFISSLDSVIPYHDSLVRAAFPYGLAWQYHQDAGNFQAATQYRDLFTDAVEKAKKTKIKFAVQYLNILMQEALDCENSIREYFGETTLTSAPFISSLDSVIPYHDSLVRDAFPYGLAWQYNQDAEKFQAATQYRDLFTDTVEKAKKTKIKFAVQYTNILMQESFNCENSIRVRDGQEPLAEVPIVASLDDAVNYHDTLTIVAFPFGLAWQYHQDAGNLQLATQYRDLFTDTVNKNYCFKMRKYT